MNPSVRLERTAPLEGRGAKADVPTENKCGFCKINYVLVLSPFVLVLDSLFFVQSVSLFLLVSETKKILTTIPITIRDSG
jgi:hypothetical protein